MFAASQEGHCEVVRMLLEAKAKVNMKNNVSNSCSSDGDSPLAESIENNQLQLGCNVININTVYSNVPVGVYIL